MSSAVSCFILRMVAAIFASAGLADEADSEVTESGHDAGSGPGPDPGRVLTVSDIADIIDWTSHCSFTAWGWLEQPVLGGG